MSDNQLKFNLKAVVDNLNLVNIVHKPEPILINKIGIKNHVHYDGRMVATSSDFRPAKASGNFELIDETKLSMYSYLIQRDLKTKEWLSKYELSNAVTTDKPEVEKKEVKKQTIKTKENKSVAFSTTVTNKLPARPILKQPLEQDVSNRIQPAASVSSTSNALKSGNEILELSKCCDDSIKSIENLYKQLNECKF
jgi:hypothetical protein